MAVTHANIDDYIASYPGEIQEILVEVRRVLHSVVPNSGEKISYQMPTITLDDRSLVYFAAWKHHLGLYPIPQADPELESRIAPFRGSKDSVRFPYKNPIPYDLIQDVAELLVTRRASG